jgi:hypothetical protein
MKRTTSTPALDAFRAGRPVEPIGYIRGRAIMPIAGGAPDDPPADPPKTDPPADPPKTDPPADPPKTDPPADPPKTDLPADLGFPKDTPVAEMTAEQAAAYHRHQSRKHEGRAKNWQDQFPGKTPAEIKAIVDKAEADRRNTLTLDQKTLEDAQAEARRSALAEIGPKAVRSAFDLLLGDMPDTDKAEVLDTLDLSKFLTSDNEVDTAKVKSHVARLNPADKAPRRRDFGAGPRRTDKSSGTKAGRDLHAERRGKKTTTSTSDS